MQLPSEVPVMTLPNVILFPQAMLPLHIFELRYRRMLRDSLHSHRMMAVAMQRRDRQRESPATVAGLGLIRASVTNSDGTSNLVLQGIARVELRQRVPHRPYRIHAIQSLPRPTPPGVAVEALTARLLELVEERLKRGTDLPFKTLAELAGGGATGEVADEASPATTPESFHDILKHLQQVDEPEQLVDLVSATLLSSPLERQAILETPGLEERLRKLVRFMHHDLDHRRTPGSHE